MIVFLFNTEKHSKGIKGFLPLSRIPFDVFSNSHTLSWDENSEDTKVNMESWKP